jgi:hypothetical protein
MQSTTGEGGAEQGAAVEAQVTGDRVNAAGVDAGWVLANGPMAAARLVSQGMLRVNGLVSAATCARLQEHVDATLAGSDLVPPAEREGYFGAVYEERRRWDMFLRLGPEVLALLKEAMRGLHRLLAEVVSETGQLCELSALVSDPGSARQPLHSDTKWQPATKARVCTCFIALQDVELDMGATVMLPRTHNEEAHRRLSNVVDQAAREAELGALTGDAATAGGLKLPVVHCTLRAGDAALMDSRLFHCGGANQSAARRRLVYFSTHPPGSLPSGSTYSMFSYYRNGLKIAEFERWREAEVAELADHVAAMRAAAGARDENEWPE